MLDTADRLLGDPGERLASKMAETVRGTVNGTVIVAVAEGVIIGAAYVVAGVPSPLIFALLTVAFAMIPFGAWIVFTTAALLLAFHGGSVFAATGRVLLRRRRHGDRRHIRVAHAGRQSSAAAVSRRTDRNIRWFANVRVDRPVYRSDDFGWLWTMWRVWLGPRSDAKS